MTQERNRPQLELASPPAGKRKFPLLVTENINVDHDGAIIEYGIALYPTPRVQIVFEP